MHDLQIQRNFQLTLCLDEWRLRKRKGEAKMTKMY